MKKGYIILAVFLLVSLAGTYAIFAKVVLPMQQELATHKSEALALQEKIKSLEITFEKTEPTAVIQGWQQKRQPWVNASKTRTSFFKIEDLPEIEMPDDAIPRFWYVDEYPKIEDALYAFAATNRITLGNIDFGINPPSYYAGKNPTKEVILEEINKYNYGVAMTKFIFGAKPVAVNDVYIWPMNSLSKGKSGEIFTRTIGYNIDIQYLNLLTFMQKLNSSDTYITIDAIKMVKLDLLAPREIMTVQLLVTDGNFVPFTTAGAAQGGGASTSGSELMVSVFGGGTSVFGNRSSAGNDEGEEESSDKKGGGAIAFFKGLLGME